MVQNNKKITVQVLLGLIIGQGSAMEAPEVVLPTPEAPTASEMQSEQGDSSRFGGAKVAPSTPKKARAVSSSGPFDFDHLEEQIASEAASRTPEKSSSGDSFVKVGSQEPSRETSPEDPSLSQLVDSKDSAPQMPAVAGPVSPEVAKPVANGEKDPHVSNGEPSLQVKPAQEEPPEDLAKPPLPAPATTPPSDSVVSQDFPAQIGETKSKKKGKKKGKKALNAESEPGLSPNAPVFEGKSTGVGEETDPAAPLSTSGVLSTASQPPQPEPQPPQPAPAPKDPETESDTESQLPPLEDVEKIKRAAIIKIRAAARRYLLGRKFREIDAVEDAVVNEENVFSYNEKVEKKNTPPSVQSDYVKSDAVKNSVKTLGEFLKTVKQLFVSSRNSTKKEAEQSYTEVYYNADVTNEKTEENTTQQEATEE